MLAKDMKGWQEVPDGFPHSMEDKQIEETITKYMSEITKSGSQENVVIQCYPLIALGQHELEKRQIRLVTRSTTRASYISLLIAVIATIIAVKNTFDSSRWEQRQIESLTTLQAELDLLNSNVRELVAVTKISHPATAAKSSMPIKGGGSSAGKQLTLRSSGTAQKRAAP